jgi:hypothetical protein
LRVPDFESISPLHQTTLPLFSLEIVSIGQEVGRFLGRRPATPRLVEFGRNDDREGLAETEPDDRFSA